MGLLIPGSPRRLERAGCLVWLQTPTLTGCLVWPVAQRKTRLKRTGGGVTQSDYTSSLGDHVGVAV